MLLALLDQLEVGLVARRIGADEADRQALRAGAAGAADAVQMVDRRARQVVVDDHRQAGQVEAAGGQVGGHQHRQPAGLQLAQHAGAPARALAAVQRLGGEAGALQLVGDMLAGVLGGHEHQHPGPALGGDQVAQQRRAARAVDQERALSDVGQRGLVGRGRLDPHRLVQHLAGQRQHRIGQRGRQQQRLPVGRQLGQQAVDLVGKALVEQAVGFVEHQRADIGQAQRAVGQQVEQAARRGQHQVGTAAQGHHLRADGSTADGRHDLDRRGGSTRRPVGQAPAQAARRSGGLQRQLAGGRQHQQAQPARPLILLVGGVQQALQQRQQEGRGLARAGGRQRQQVVAVQHHRQCRCLDGSGHGPAHSGGGLRERGRQAQRGERWQQGRYRSGARFGGDIG